MTKEPPQLSPEQAVEAFDSIRNKYLADGYPQMFSTRQARVQTYDYFQRKGFSRADVALQLHRGLRNRKSQAMQDVA